MRLIDLPAFDRAGSAQPVSSALSWRAAHDTGPAFTFLANGDTPTHSLDFAQLHTRACAIAKTLTARLPCQSRVLLLYPSGLDFVEAFWGCLYAGMVAVPAACPDSVGMMRRALPRMIAVFMDSQPDAILTTSVGMGLLDELGDMRSALGEVPCLVTADIPSDEGAAPPPVDIRPDHMALLQYTSGSTGRPRGIEVTHGQLMANQRMIYEMVRPRGTERHVAVCWLPFHHDMGLIGNLIQSVYQGGHCVMMPPMDFVRRPLKWLQAVSRYKATISGGPNFAFDLCTDRITAEQIRELDLSHWNTAFCGAEPIRAATLERFAKAMAPAGFNPRAWTMLYGLAEATVLVSATRWAPESPNKPLVQGFASDALQQGRVQATPDSDARLLVACGELPAEVGVRIVDAATGEAARADETGEIWVSGPAVASGYWRQPELSSHTFQARLAHDPVSYLRTGDIGFMHEGQLFVAGRMKDLIIVRGRNHYPTDIEFTVTCCHPALSERTVAAFAVEAEGREHVATVVELAAWEPSLADELLAAIQEAVTASHQIAVDCIALVPAGAIPRTSSGKLQRAACRKLLMKGGMGTLRLHASASFPAVPTEVAA